MNILDKLGYSPETDGELPSHSLSEIQEVVLDAEHVKNAAKTSLDFLAAFLFPHTYKFPFPPIFLSLWTWLIEYVDKIRDFSQLALGLPRGFGKTMVIKIFVLYCILFTKKKFILIFSETESKAKNIIADIVDALDDSNVKRVFGDWRLGLEIDQQALKKFGFRGRNIILMGAGAGTGIRGITIKNERPDIMIFDDIQSREVAESQIQSENLEKWMVGTAMKAKSPHGCLFIFIANMYPTKWSILRKLKSNPTWIKFIVGGILSDGTSLWEELQPIKQLKQELANDLAFGRPEIFFSEVLNDENASGNYLIDLSALPAPPFEEDDIAGGNFVIIDPATDKLGADAVSVGYFEVLEGFPILKDLTEDSLSPGDTIKKALEYCFKYNCRLVAVESNAYQYTLKYWFDFICQQSGIYGIEAVDIYSGTLSKNSRIIAMLRSYAKGEIFVSEKCKPAVHLQIAQFNPLKRDNTDGLLDLLTYAPRVIEQYADFIVSTNVIESQDFDLLEPSPVEANSYF